MLDIHLITEFQIKNWGKTVFLPEEWSAMCHALDQYKPPAKSLKLHNPERKWELVSAYQKAVRRGDVLWAMRFVSAMDSQPVEWPYFVRRICTTACEDVGAANELVAVFVIAATTVFTPKKVGSDSMYKLACFLTELMCTIPFRSRMWCSLSIIENIAKEQGGTAAVPVVHLLNACNSGVGSSQYTAWLVNNNWRGEGMLKYARVGLGWEMVEVFVPMLNGETMKGLPSYAYDMHTRAGIQALGLFAKLPSIASLLKNVKLHRKALGYAVFFLEGGRIKNELLNIDIAREEQSLVATSFDMSFDQWQELRWVVWKELEEGFLDDARALVLKGMYP